MHYNLPDANGGGASPSAAPSTSSTLPFGKPVPLSHISGPTYVTAQLLVQQVAYKLSDKIFSYSPETYDLDVAARAWAEGREPNAHGYVCGPPADAERRRRLCARLHVLA